MIEHQLAAVPPSKGRGHAGQNGQGQPDRQDLFGVMDTQAGIGGADGQQDHGRNGMVPTCDAHADARHGQQFERAGNGCDQAEGEGEAGRPQTDLEPEIIARPPVEDIDAQRGNDQGDGKMNQHGMDRMTSYGDGRADILLGNFANGRVGMVRPRLGRSLLIEQFLIFLRGFVERRLGHFLAPGFKLTCLLATPWVLAGCTGDLSSLDPAGPRAADLALLWWVMLAGSAVLFILVMGLLAATYLWPQRLSGLSATQWIVGGGLILPIPVLIVLTGTALVLGEQLLPQGSAPVRAEAHAERWSWHFAYPDAPGFADDEALHIPAGLPVDIAVTSADVIHSFWIPRLGGKIDAIPGHSNTIRLEASEPGTYWGVCAEYCGPGHETMVFKVIAHGADDFAQLMTGGAQ